MNLKKNTPAKAGKNRRALTLATVFIALLTCLSCTQSQDKKDDISVEKDLEIVIKKRKDGTKSSVSQVDKDGVVNGLRVNYYKDGKSIYSRVTYTNGRKNGPANWYYKNGQISLHLNYINGKKQGPSMRYYMSGKLLAETKYINDYALPGLKEYSMDGVLQTSYPKVEMKEIDQLTTKNKITIELTCSRKSDKVKYYLLEEVNGKTNRIYIITENGSASKTYYVVQGETINKLIEFYVEIPTDLDNTMVKKISYQLTAANPW